MNAEDLAFPDNSFNVVVAMYVMTVVPNPEQVLSEIEHVCVPGSRVIIVNHFAKEDGLRSILQRRLSPICNILGWRTDFYVDGILSRTSLSLQGIQTVGLFGLFTLLQFHKRCSSFKESISIGDGSFI